jgi:hypothetical protein
MKRIALLIAISLSTLEAADYFDETKATTLFAFDNVSIPHTQNLKLEMRAACAASVESGREAWSTGHAGCAWRAVLWLHHQGQRQIPALVCVLR